MTLTADATTRRLFTLAGSAFIVLAAEPLYLLVDTAVVGHLGAVPLGGLGIGAALMSLISMIGAFLDYGTTGRAARWFGAGRTDEAINEGVQASWLAVVLGGFALVIGEVFAGPLTSLLAGENAAVQHAAESWFRIAVIGIPGVLLVLAGHGWLRGVQEVRAPVIIVLLANGISAVLCPVLVYPAGLGLEGSAIANVTAQAIGGLAFVIALVRRSPKWRARWSVISAQLLVARDLLLREVGFQAAFLTAAAVAARMGSAQIGAHQIGLQLWEFVALLLDSFAIAAQSLVGAALGASDEGWARSMAWQVARYGLWAGIGFSVLLAMGWWAIPQAFTSSSAVVHQAHLLWPWFIAMLPFAGVVFALDGVLIGAGDVGFLRTITLIGALCAFVPLNLAAWHWHWGIGGVWAGLTAFILVRFVGMVGRTQRGHWAVVGEQR